MDTKFIVYSLSALVILGLSGCSGGGDGGCSTVEPAWTQTVAPMVTREDGGEAAALVRAVDVVASGQLFDVMASSNKKVASPGAQKGLETLSALLTPNMSMSNVLSSGLKTAKSTTKTPLLTPLSGVPQPCNYGGTVTITYADTLERFVPGDRNISTTFTFDHCIEDSGIINYITQEIYATVSSVFPGVVSAGVSGNEVNPEKVTLDGEIGAKLRLFSGESSVPEWMGPPSWATYTGTKPDSVITAFQRAEIFTTDFSAEFTTEGTEASLLFESDMDLYFEYNTILDFNHNIPLNLAPINFPGFTSTGDYIIAGANGCIQATASEGTDTYDLLSVRALGLESVGYLDYSVPTSEKAPLGSVAINIPGMMSLNGFIEASLNDGDFSFSLKADGFYRADGYFRAIPVNIEPRPSAPVSMIGYLGSECLDGMLFINAEFGKSYGDVLPTYGIIGFFAEVPDGPIAPLGAIEFLPQAVPAAGTLTEEGPPQPAAYLSIADVPIGIYTSWSSLIGENACTMPPVEAP